MTYYILHSSAREKSCLKASMGDYGTCMAIKPKLVKNFTVASHASRPALILLVIPILGSYTDASSTDGWNCSQVLLLVVLVCRRGQILP